MRKYRLPAILATIAAAMLLQVAEGTAGDKKTEPQAYEVMSAFIRAQYGSEFNMILISRDTESLCLGERLDFLQRQWPELKKETIDSLIVNNSGVTCQLAGKFRIPVKYRLISDTEYLHALLGNTDPPGDKTLKAGGKSAVSGVDAYAAISGAAEPDWDRFDKAFPDAQGYLTFSRVGFDSGRTQALVIFSNAYRCSGSRVMPNTRKIACFRNRNGAWELVGISRSINTMY